MSISEEERQKYISELISYYYKLQEFKNIQHIKRQIVNMDDNTLIADYNLRVIDGSK